MQTSDANIPIECSVGWINENLLICNELEKNGGSVKIEFESNYELEKK